MHEDDLDLKVLTDLWPRLSYWQQKHILLLAIFYVNRARILQAIRRVGGDG